MDRTERLLNLVAFFLDTRHLVSLEEIRDTFPDEYTGSDEASGRKFERDKADLYDLGIPLRFVAQTDEEPGGYHLDREAYYLPEPGFTAEELAVLYAAGSAALTSGAFPGRHDLAYALRKIGFFTDTPLTTSNVRLEVFDAKSLPAKLDTIWAGIASRKSIDVDYFSPRNRTVTSRRIDPYGLALRRGVWNLVGWCHLRNELRTFHVHRIRRIELNVSKPKQADFTIPEDFTIDAHVATWPWDYRLHAPQTITLSLSDELVPLAPQLFGAKTEQNVLTLTVTNLDALLNQVLSLGSGAKLIGPETARVALKERAQRVLDLHGAAS